MKRLAGIVICILFLIACLPVQGFAAGDAEELYYKEVLRNETTETWEIDPVVHRVQDRPYWRNVTFSLVFCDASGNQLEGDPVSADPAICTIEKSRKLDGAFEILGVEEGTTELNLTAGGISYSGSVQVIGDELMAYPVRVDENGEYVVMGGLQVSLDDWDLEVGHSYLIALSSSSGMLREGLAYSSYDDDICTLTYKKTVFTSCWRNPPEVQVSMSMEILLI